MRFDGRFYIFFSFSGPMHTVERDGRWRAVLALQTGSGSHVGNQNLNVFRV